MTRAPDGSLRVSRVDPGRGAWLCRGSAACLDRAARRRAFERALRGPVADGATERLRTDLGLGAPGPGPDGGRGPGIAPPLLGGTEALMCEDGEPGRRHGGRKREGH